MCIYSARRVHRWRQYRFHISGVELWLVLYLPDLLECIRPCAPQHSLDSEAVKKQMLRFVLDLKPKERRLNRAFFGCFMFQGRWVMVGCQTLYHAADAHVCDTRKHLLEVGLGAPCQLCLSCCIMQIAIYGSLVKLVLAYRNNVRLRKSYKINKTTTISIIFI